MPSSGMVDATYLRLVNPNGKALKQNRSTFAHSGSTSSILTNCGNPNLNLLAFNDLQKAPVLDRQVFNTLPTVSPEVPISSPQSKCNYREYRGSSKLGRDLSPPKSGHQTPKLAENDRFIPLENFKHKYAISEHLEHCTEKF